MKELNTLEKIAFSLTKKIGSLESLILHTLLFVGTFVLMFLNVDVDTILLILTTALSIEAIYLAIFIQMTVNRSSERLQEVEEDIGEIEKDIDDIQEDVEDIQEEHRADDVQEARNEQTLLRIQKHLQEMVKELERLKKQSVQ